MNERIKELAISAGYGDRWNTTEQFDTFLDCFAELIVRECIKAASDPGDGLIKDDTWHDGVRACVWSIQDEFNFDRTFGVKE